MTTIHLVSHTHWDREWYLPFQLFRLKLIHLMDNLLALLAADPGFKHFMLDGQTTVLDDYLQIRPEREAEIRAHVQSGRLVIGPWHILPDMFLVGPEAHIRNLLEGDRTTRRFGPKMPVGYIPDPFGHPGQVPQILRGFGLETACLWRGLDDQPCEFWWEAPDGSRVLMAYLRDSYGNGASLPTSDGDRFTAEIKRAAESLAAHTTTGHVLIMHGTDHMEPPSDTSSAIGYANSHLDGDAVLHSTLPVFVAAIREQIGKSANQQISNEILTVRGELRSSKRSHLLPGVLSARMWIKQRNQACETLLEKWAEPFSAWASFVTADRQPMTAKNPSVIGQPSSVVHHAWRLLMECHPHDSICGCSVDQVHDEMRPRFDQVAQIGEEITRQSLEAIAGAVDTGQISKSANKQMGKSAIVVFNPTVGPRTDGVRVETQLPAGWVDFDIVDEAGQIIPHQSIGMNSRELINAAMDRKTLTETLKMVHKGRAAGMVFRDIQFHQEGSSLRVEAILSDTGEPDAARWKQWMQAFDKFLTDPAIETVIVRARSAPATAVIFSAPEIPGHGFRTFWLQEKAVGEETVQPVRVSGIVQALLPLAGRVAPVAGRLLSRPVTEKPPYVIENEFFHVEAAPATGTLTVTDKRNGAVYRGLNRFVDGGDCGDEYNYSLPERDTLVTARLDRVHIERGDVQQTMELRLAMTLPAGLTPDRKARSPERVTIPVMTRVILTGSVPRVDVHTEIENGNANITAADHRLRVHFPAPFAASAADYDGHFEIVRRPLALPAFDETWVEQPRPEKPQRAFTAVSDGNLGLMIVNRGLPEVEALARPDGTVEIALTLLRCVGWLSRDDFATRRGHAGPMEATPGAQMPGKHAFDYAIIPFASDMPVEQAYAFNAPLRAVSASLHEGSLPAQASMISVAFAPRPTPHAPRFTLSAIKSAEDGRGWIVRGCNLGSEPLDVTLTPWRRFGRAERVNLAEEMQETLSVGEDGSVTVAARGHEIVTVRFE